MLFASKTAVGTLLECSFTKKRGFSGNGNCSLWTNETVSRPSAAHATVSQTASSAARLAATCSISPSLLFSVYAQPPSTFTSPKPSSADPFLAIKNATVAAKSKATAPFELSSLVVSGLPFVLEPIRDQPNSGAKACAAWGQSARPPTGQGP